MCYSEHSINILKIIHFSKDYRMYNDVYKENISIIKLYIIQVCIWMYVSGYIHNLTLSFLKKQIAK